MANKRDIVPVLTVFRLVGKARRYISNYMNKFKTAYVIITVKEQHVMVTVCLSWKEGGCVVLHGSRRASLGNK